jgi:outer membrane scaffolding protein for murein synthesis (MipA/OmpV family)
MKRSDLAPYEDPGRIPQRSQGSRKGRIFFIDRGYFRLAHHGDQLALSAEVGPAGLESVDQSRHPDVLGTSRRTGLDCGVRASKRVEQESVTNLANSINAPQKEPRVGIHVVLR